MEKKLKVVTGNSIDDVYKTIIELKSRYGKNNVIVDQKDLYGFLHRETFINQNGAVEHRIKWSVYISLNESTIFNTI